MGQRKCRHDDGWKKSDLPDGVFANRLWITADAYRQSAEHLFKVGEVVRQPAYFTACHSIELSLKSFLAAKGYKRKDFATRAGHCLECLVERAVVEGLPEVTPDLEKLVRHLSSYTEIYRYPDFFIEQHIRSDEVLETANFLIHASEPAMLKAMIESWEDRNFEVDTFRHTPKPA